MPELAVIDNTGASPTRDDILARVRAEIERRGITQAQAAREIGVSPTTLTQLLGGTYAADPSRQLERLARWLGMQEEQRAQPVMPAAPQWVTTPTAERVIAALGYAQMAGDVAVIYGGAGLGKTTAAREYARRYPNVWLATMSPATSGVTTALEEVCLALGFRDLPQGAARMQRAIVDRVRGTGGLLVVDESQHLGVAALDALRAIHDAAGVGLALIGNEMVYARMTGGSRAAYLDRLFSRIGKRVRLARATREDVERLASAFGVRNGSLKLLVEIGGRAGALRAVVKTLRLASMMAGGSEIEPQHIEAAWKDLEGV
ncbi:MAG TPA: AAA family ATPase [Burkholderiales bacterium]|nr:AAA family ATPase [Burkholderiales bacterium]